MKNYIEKGRILTVTAQAAVSSGDALLIGDILVVAVTSANIGDQFACDVRGVFELPKAAVAINQGVAVYWDDVAKNITTVTAGNKQIGFAWSAQLAADPTIYVKLPF